MTAEEKAKARLAKFQEAKKKAEEEKANKGGFPKEDVPEFKCCILKKDTPKIIRLVGNSPLMRELPSDPIIVKRAVVKTDDDKWTTIILSDDREHPVNKLWRTIIGKYKFDKENNVRIYDNKGKPSFERFIRNGKNPKDCDAKERGMTPDTFYLFNCIDKTDNWCEENKHTKLLCWDSSTKEVDGETREYPTYGIKPSLYNNIFDEQCTALNRMYDQFDVVVKRLSKKLGDSWIQVFSPEEKSKISLLKLDPNKVSMEYLTDEEDAYEKYVLEDVPFVSRPTSASYVSKILSKLIKQADIDFGTNLQGEFAEWIEKEKAEFAKRNAEKANSESKTEDTSTEVESEDEEVVEESTTTTPSFDTMNKVEESSDDELPSEVEENPTPTEPIKKVAKVAKSVAFNLASYYDEFPHLKELSDEDKKLIVGFDETSRTFKFIENREAECPACGHSVAEDTMACPYCGVCYE